jgi:pentatricopeptide repeat protein
MKGLIFSHWQISLILVLTSNTLPAGGFVASKINYSGKTAKDPFRKSWKSSSPVLFMVQSVPPRNLLSSSAPYELPRKRPPRIRKARVATFSKDKGSPAGADNNIIATKLQKALKVESQLTLALESLQTAAHEKNPLSSVTRQSTDDIASSTVSGLLFPSVRECNAALATFGDGEELLRALRLFMRMRKAALLAKHLQDQVGCIWPVPAPTLVTYSTIMSRANRMGKPRVALRMWKLLQNSPEFVHGRATFSTSTPSRLFSNTIVPDIKAGNILMNSYAKLADIASCRNLLQQMIYGNGTDVPRMTPNLVTHNTLLDACHKAEDLDAALDAKAQLEEFGLTPDAWTYTSLIATVARKPSAASGVNDPTLAFTLLEEMVARDIRPNGMTYSALIDACGRCGRCDLALKGLRIMLRQKAQEQEALVKNDSTVQKTNYKGNPKNYTLSNEVGAWTAAINACGKAGRLDAAIRLFYSMPNFGVKPNTVTCGCLTDSLLKHGRTAETLKVLRYMDENGIAPSEVMYTSLMSSAENLVQLERTNGQQPMTAATPSTDSNRNSFSSRTLRTHASATCGAIEVYTELMKSLMEDRLRVSNDNLGRQTNQQNKADNQDTNAHLLMKVFLVFQEMKDVGAQPDLACYNALLRACARAGDVTRAQSVLKQLQDDSLEPNDTSWRQLIRAAGNARRCDLVISTWKMAMDYSYDINSHLGSDHSQIRCSQWMPSIETFGTLVSALLRRASDPSLNPFEKRLLYQRIVSMYESVLSGNRDKVLGLHRVDASQLVENQRAMLLILQAVVFLEELTPLDGSVDPNALDEKRKLRDIATRTVQVDALHDISKKQRLSRNAFRSLRIAQTWAEHGFVGSNFQP